MMITHKENYTEYRVLDEFGYTVAVFVYVNIASKVDLFAYAREHDILTCYVGHVSI